jgi:hypothetical protein
MEKENTIKQLRDAKRAHIKWVQRAKALIEGLPVEKEQVPVDCTECMFGQWFYGEGQGLNSMPGMDCTKEIEALHYELHDIYMMIFKIYFTDMNRSFLSKLFGTSKKITDHEKDVARDHYKRLKDVSERLLLIIEKLERRLSALPESAFPAI